MTRTPPTHRAATGAKNTQHAIDDSRAHGRVRRGAAARARLLVAVAAVGLLLVSITGCAAGRGVGTTQDSQPATGAVVAGAGSADGSPVPATAPPSGTAAAAAWEALMSPQGEYAAAAAYTAVIEKFGDNEPYVSILAAEEHHIAALKRQLERLGYSAPDNPWLGQVPAPADLVTAAQAWADGEIANAALYDRLLEQVTDDAMLTTVFTRLQQVSLEVHLPLFQQAAAGNGTI